MNHLEQSEASDAMLADYNAWMALGQGGIPSTWAGYLGQLALDKSLSLDTVSTAVYHDPATYVPGWKQASETQQAAAQRSYLASALPQRQGPRSHAKRYVFPQRERNADEPLDPELKAAYQNRFTRLGEVNGSFTEWRTSVLEKHGQALFLQSSKPIDPLLSATQREICHIHGGDSSAHVTLSLPDAEQVIVQGWGERHRLSGTERLPLGYTLLYVPKSLEEIEVLGDIFQAGVEFCANQ